MKKMIQWVLVATLICGASVFTACSSDNDDNPAQEQAKRNRKEFIQHTRATMKDLAENLNFSTWNSVNYFNMGINEYVLLNDDFDKTLSRTVGMEIQKSIRPLPADAVERYGKKYTATVNLADFDYIFTATATGFDVTPNTEDGLVMEIVDPYSPEVAIRIDLKGSGEEFELLSQRMSNDSVGVLVRIPARYNFTFCTKQNGAWVENMTATTELTVNKGQYSDDNLPAVAADMLMDGWNLKGTVKTSIPGDATELEFNIGQDPKTHQAGLTFDFTHNGQKRLGLRAVGTNTNGNTDLSFLTSSSSILSAIGAVLQGKSVDDLTLTLNDDLTTTMKVSDCQKVMQIETEMNKARRNYADQQTMSGYADEMNKYITISMTCKGVNQEIPVRIVAAKLGVDWWVMPALNFADENGYTPLTDLLDKESLEYGINIIDHAAEPMQQSIIVVRQLAQALQKLQTAFLQTKPAQAPRR
ncbi:MAG: hypothetical protein J5502_07125 [Prevotella sp.]|nr:hypothetical protein [Prevotella sp.]